MPARIKTMAKDLQASNFVSRASKTSCLRDISKAKFLVRCAAALRYIEEDAADVFRGNHVRDNLLLAFIEEEAVLLLMALWR